MRFNEIIVALNAGKRCRRGISLQRVETGPLDPDTGQPLTDEHETQDRPGWTKNGQFVFMDGAEVMIHRKNGEVTAYEPSEHDKKATDWEVIE